MTKPGKFQTKQHRGQEVMLIDTLYWLTDPDSGDELGWSMHEHFLGPILAGLLPENGVFLDIGAHVGHWAIRLAKHARKVYAVEANIPTAYKLKIHAEANHLENKMVILPFAASDGVYEVGLFDPYRQATGGSTKIDGPGPVIAMPLDGIIQDDIDLVKIDVEGHEVEVIRGMQNLIRKTQPAMVIEMHGPLYPELDIEPRLHELLTSLEYDHTVLVEHKTPEGQVVCEYWLCQPKD